MKIRIVLAGLMVALGIGQMQGQPNDPNTAAFNQWCRDQHGKHAELHFTWTDSNGRKISETWVNEGERKPAVTATPTLPTTPTPTPRPRSTLNTKAGFEAHGNFPVFQCADNDTPGGGFCVRANPPSGLQQCSTWPGIIRVSFGVDCPYPPGRPSQLNYFMPRCRDPNEYAGVGTWVLDAIMGNCQNGYFKDNSFLVFTAKDCLTGPINCPPPCGACSYLVNGIHYTKVTTYLESHYPFFTQSCAGLPDSQACEYQLDRRTVNPAVDTCYGECQPGGTHTDVHYLVCEGGACGRDVSYSTDDPFPCFLDTTGYSCSGDGNIITCTYTDPNSGGYVIIRYVYSDQCNP